MNGRKGPWWALAVAALGVGASTALAQAGLPVAVVNGQAITQAELDAVLKQVPPSSTPLTEAQRLENKQYALEILIRDVLLRQFVEREYAGKPTFKPNSPEVNKQIEDVQTELKKKNESFDHFLTDSGQTEAQLRADIVKHLQWQAFLKSRINDEYLKRYYEAYKPFFDKVGVRARQIMIRVPQNAKDSDRQLARNRLLAIRQSMLAKQIDFVEAAKKYSDCGAEDGGDLGYFPRKGRLLEPLAQAAFALKVGEMSDVVETEVGFHLLKVEDRTPGQPSDFEKIKDDVRAICMMELSDAILTQQQKTARIVNNLR